MGWFFKDKEDREAEAAAARGEELNDLHNKGQEDQSRGGKYDQPHDCGHQLLAGPDEYRKMVEDSNAYAEGWDNSRKQSKS